MSDFRAELLAAFAAEHREHLGAIREALSAEDGDGAVELEPAALREVFRRAHSLKGAARAVDLPGLEAVAHRVESLLAREMEAAAGGPARLSPPTLALLHRGLDAIEASASAMAAGAEAPPVEAVLAALDGDPAPSQPPPAAPRAAEGPAPAPPAAHPTPPTAPTPTAAPPTAPSTPGEGHLRVEAARVERLSAAMHGLKVLIGRQDSTIAGLRGLEAELRALRRGWDGLRAALPADPALAPRLRGFDAALGEAVRRLSGLSRQGRAMEDALDRAASTLQEEVEAIALVPAATVLGPLAAAAREMAREAGREVTVRTEGLEAQAERRVLQALKDPVLHLLRNALGHGAPRDGRRAEIGLRVAATGGGLRVTVWDNGPGPDLGSIEATAIRRGLLAPRAPGSAPPSADALLALVFEPGFSTAAEVDRLSGRGMGLSVVAEAAAALHGGAALRPRPPVDGAGGAEVVIALPPSTGRRSLLLVEAGGQVFGLPGGNGLVSVGPLLRIDPASIIAAEGRPVARLGVEGGEALVPLASLAALIGRAEEPSPGPVPAVLLARGGARLALTVSALRDARSLVVTEVDAPGVDTALVSGAALLEDEAVALVLSPDGLLDRGLREAARPGAARPLAPAAPERRRHILVVDDSITTRTLERSVLEAGGYRVTLAVDGLDALNSLREPGASVDLVLADVEMPRMDGFGLIEAIRADPHLAELPVILMTSRDSPGDVQRGMELGASAYLTKQGFDGGALLAAIGQLV
ncbi:response regulator [Pararoseomonas sp. SCSIO 73927]|uniref:ATP-binding response regulator n=1 Tax=Pararoseomonas sp. SCSIO 73927 TaxID=3114537 RepID=UPI0030D1694E